MEGYLKKWTNYVTRWKKRYFNLKNAVLEYGKTPRDKNKSRIYLKTTDISRHKNKKRIVLNTGTIVINLKAPSEKEAQEWINALRLSKDTPQPHQTEDLCKHRISMPDLMEAINYTKKIWNVHRVMEEKYNLIPLSIKEQIQDFMESATEFKNLAVDTLNLLEEERKKDVEEPISEGEDEFQDAKSHVTEIFEEIKHEELQIPYRNKLPVIRNSSQKYNIWKVLKDTIGKDMSKMAVPVYFNEPLSFLQRFTEDLTYSELLKRAANCEDSCLRLALVACFAVSSYTPTSQRLMKPFNPILGETYELEKDGFKAVSEQVSHHPPVSAIHCESPEYSFYASTSLKTSFKGTYLKLRPEGKCHVLVHRYKDHYIWEKPYTNVNNIIIGTLNVDHHGKFEIKNINTDEVAVIIMKKKGWFNKDQENVVGSVLDSNGATKYTIRGYWNSGLKIYKEDSIQEIHGYTSHPPLIDYENYYFYTEFAMQLNLPPDLVPGIPSTDSRFRPDQRALENGNIELATSEKMRLEEKQRKAKKNREENLIEYKPMWFYIDQNNEWAYKGGYWAAKENKSFIDCPDIF